MIEIIGICAMQGQKFHCFLSITLLLSHSVLPLKTLTSYNEQQIFNLTIALG